MIAIEILKNLQYKHDKCLNKGCAIVNKSRIADAIDEINELTTYPQSEYDEIFKTIIEIRKIRPDLRFGPILEICGSLKVDDAYLVKRLKGFLKSIKS